MSFSGRRDSEFGNYSNSNSNMNMNSNYSQKGTNHIRSRSAGTPVELESCFHSQGLNAFPDGNDSFLSDPRQDKSIAAMTELESRLLELQSAHQQILSEVNQELFLHKGDSSFQEVRGD